MKAYCVYPGDSYDDSGCVLIYAKTRNEARQIGWRWWPSLTTWCYIEFNALRKPKYDKFYNGIRIIETNEDLMKNAPPFYSDG